MSSRLRGCPLHDWNCPGCGVGSSNGIARSEPGISRRTGRLEVKIRLGVRAPKRRGSSDRLTSVPIIRDRQDAVALLEKVLGKVGSSLALENTPIGTLMDFDTR
jgi:hypothetical protein